VIWALLALGAVAAAAVALCIRFARRLRQERREYRADVATLKKALEERAELIRKMEEANGEAAKKKDSLHHGTDAERFDTSKRILSDIAGTSDRAAEDTD
jgi:biopolymer transport protein ExbB/TolQ